ncbi:hypothetical protein AVEN_130426-1 [Araneus ventricosus]|uniref:Uncharacterized protein n=1 Tax=Araneus ventricosus TaxID=182803 RepID=A0A4Y2N8N4_ARAVE|nr:hypothetical protein AVEN_130426-1 [Araneus ventricosus]
MSIVIIIPLYQSLSMGQDPKSQKLSKSAVITSSTLNMERGYGLAIEQNAFIMGAGVAADNLGTDLNPEIRLIIDAAAVWAGAQINVRLCLLKKQ